MGLLGQAGAKLLAPRTRWRKSEVLAPRKPSVRPYLAWLKTLEMEDLLDSDIGPPVPPGLNKLSPALHTFVDFFEIDEFLIRSAAQASSDRETASKGWLRGAMALLSEEERFSATPGTGRSAVR